MSIPNHKPTKGQPQLPTQKRKPGSLEQIARYSDLALVLPAGLAAGWILGALLDKLCGTHWIYLPGIFVGLIGGFIRLVRVAIGKEK